ncbi:UDP-glucose 4-epimerase GalE [Deinococcus deserti]|uniref:UDP-glucose 4-epimerase n=1 Tax=Deinococcus deserti (strain DSM 17065 / CIP 109153 / LMG 22923 / VCD115) TaxID=546414 RepID=C1CYC2_DEIDV|nr:UDP-glucose 4-epimerase GalE [Deinococcus deserti]ACO44943.1 putative UDP-glucose 4-epimerase (Galactowaldenase) (UDP-galactose 4-epimerase) [Deinococcus deserti VCD115]
MKLLVVGGAGYIGSHTVRQLRRSGHEVVVLDNLSSGHREALPEDVTLVQQDLLDAEGVKATLQAHEPDAVIHFAALIEVGESMRAPARYYRNNVVGSLNLLQAIVETRKIPLVFSSTAAVYGTTDAVPIPENAPMQPESVYGETKLMTERMIHAFHTAHGLPYVILRYFNVCGAAPEGDIGEAHANKTHLIELAALTALGQREKMMIFGDDYPTPDGTCIRDYVHVQDLADAHVLAVEALHSGKTQAATYNVGLGHGFSVREVLDAVDAVTGKPLTRELAPRRAGDPPRLVADATRIVKDLGFKPRFTDLQEIVQTAWTWHKSHPHDFRR